MSTVNGLPFANWVNPWLQSTLALDVSLSSQLSLDQISCRQSHRLDRLLRTAREHSPFFRETLGSLQSDSPPGLDALAALPAMTRHAVMEHFDQWCTDRRITREKVKTFTTQKHNIAQAFLGQYTVWESSGTHGEPGYFVQDPHSMAVYDALEGLRRSHDGAFVSLLLGERIAFVGALGGHFASFVSVERLRRLYPWLAPTIQSFSIMQNARTLVDELNAFQPTAIATYPTAAALLADKAQAGHLHTRPRYVWTGGETLSDAVRHHVQDSLNCTVRNHYGASEFLTIGWECHLGNMHVNADWVILEPVDQQMRRVAAGTEPATTLLTNLANHVQPLIRYDIGDKVVIKPEPCQCGAPLPLIEVLGRDDDSLVMAGIEDGSSVTILPLALMTAIEDDAGIFDFQLFQKDARSLVIRLPGDDKAKNQALVKRCRKALSRFEANQGLAPIDLISETKPLLRGKSGKIGRIFSQSSLIAINKH